MVTRTVVFLEAFFAPIWICMMAEREWRRSEAKWVKVSVCVKNDQLEYFQERPLVDMTFIFHLGGSGLCSGVHTVTHMVDISSFSWKCVSVLDSEISVDPFQELCMWLIAIWSKENTQVAEIALRASICLNSGGVCQSSDQTCYSNTHSAWQKVRSHYTW